MLIDAIKSVVRTIKFAALGLGTVLCCSSASGQEYQPGHIMVMVPSGTDGTTMAAIAASNGLVGVRDLGVINSAGTLRAFDVQIPVGADPLTATDIALAKLKADSRVSIAHKTKMYRVFQQIVPASAPLDPLYSTQWDMAQIKMPTGWSLFKGAPNVAVAVIDTGVDIDHPDFDKSRILAPYNSMAGAANTADPRPSPGTPNEHGTLVSGIVMATANNGVGLTGVAWENSKLVPIKAGAGGGFTGADLVAAINYVVGLQSKFPGIKFIINMSLGGTAPSDVPADRALITDALELATLAAADKGILCVISAGNSGFEVPFNSPKSPAYLSMLSNNIIAVGATDSFGSHATYSTFKSYVNIAAPGGNVPIGEPMHGLTTVADGLYKDYPLGGTSSAAPHVSGVAALMLGNEGVNVSAIKSLIQATATRVPGATIPSAEYGYGILNAFSALSRVVKMAYIATPDGYGGRGAGSTFAPRPTETLRPVIRVQALQIRPSQLSIKVDSINIPVSTGSAGSPSFTVEDVQYTTLGTSGTQEASVYQAVIRNLDMAPGQHRIEVSATNLDTGEVVSSDFRNFMLSPHEIPAGRSLVSIPFYQNDLPAGNVTDVLPETYLGSNYGLARWIPSANRYAYWTSFGLRDSGSGFTPGDFLPRPEGSVIPTYPLGIGYWADLDSNHPILTHGAALTDGPYLLPLKGTGGTGFVSWNMVGDPFPFDVALNSVLVDTPSGRLSIADAVRLGYILGTIWSYDSATGYNFKALPDGAFQAWKGHWIGVTSSADITLVVPPVVAGRTAASSGVSATDLMWSLNIQAHVKAAHDTSTVIGVAKSATDGVDRLDVLRPPSPDKSVSVSVDNSTWSKLPGRYMRDVRSGSGNKEWPLVVDTDIPDSTVLLTWNASSLPRNIRVTLKDVSTNTSIDMRTRASYSFQSTTTGAQRRLIVATENGIVNPLVIRNLNVRTASKGAGLTELGFNLSSDASYSARRLSGSGSVVANVTSRAASAGDVRVPWTGRDNGGRSVPAGTYLFEVVAKTAEGATARAVFPISIVR